MRWVYRKTVLYARPDWGLALFLIAAVCLGHFCASRGCRVVRPAAQALFLAAKKSPPKKAALPTASPSLRYGATCGARAWGVRRNSLRAAALRSNSRRKLVHEAVALYGATATPRPVLLGAFRRVRANTDSFSIILIAAHAYRTGVKHQKHQQMRYIHGSSRPLKTSSPTLLSTPGAHSDQRKRARDCLSAASLARPR